MYSLRKLRDSLKAYSDEVHVVGYLNILKEALWPGGRLKPAAQPRTAEQRFHSKEQANRKLSALFPGWFKYKIDFSEG